MVKYVMVASTLKLFSTCPPMRRAYRLLGNTVGATRRTHRGLRRLYVDRAKRLVELCEQYQVVQRGNHLLEIGTGWVHWYALFLRLFHDVDMTLFDVWDNRQLEPLKRYCEALARLIDAHEVAIAPTQAERVHRLLQTVTSVGSFDELYRLLGFRYVAEPSGTLRQFPDETFHAIFSDNVLEHVPRATLAEYLGDCSRVLKPDGYSIHTIDLGDHLAYYDRTVSVKNYLRFSDAVWKRWFENDVQYFNRVQRPEWLHLFQQAGFELVKEESSSKSLGIIPIDRQYRQFDPRDLECTTLTVVHRKPSSG